MAEYTDETIGAAIKATTTLVETLIHAHKGSDVLDLEMARLIGFYDRYATNLGRDPERLVITLKNPQRAWNETPRVNIHVRNENGGGIIYSDDLPNFTGDLSIALKTLPKQDPELKPGEGLQWNIHVNDYGAVGQVSVRTVEGRVQGEGYAPTPALAVCVMSLRCHTELKLLRKASQDCHEESGLKR
jgi:hypothetical protein